MCQLYSKDPLTTTSTSNKLTFSYPHTRLNAPFLSAFFACALAAGAPTLVQAGDNSTPFQQSSNGLVVIEAENYHASLAKGGHEWKPAAKPGYSGSGAMQASPEDSVGLDTNYANTSPRLDYKIQFVTTGTHYVWVRGLGPSGTSDSLHVGLDGIEVPTGTALYTNPWNSWVWARKRPSAIATVNVTSPGLHTINVWMRESGTLVDKLVLTKDSKYIPTSTGPAESARATTTPPSSAKTDVNTPVNINVPVNGGTIALVSNPSHGSASITGNTITYTPTKGYVGQDTLVYKIISSNGAVTLTTLTLNVGCSDCFADVNLKLTWNPNSEEILGYLVYYGSSPSTVNRQLSDLSIDQGEINAKAPAVMYNAKTVLGISSGGTACFRVKAYNTQGESDFSKPACITL